MEENTMTVRELKAKILRVIFSKDEFSICACSTDTQLPQETITGYNFADNQYEFTAAGYGLPNVPGREVLLSGEWEFQQKYNNYRLTIYDSTDYIGTSREEIIAYMSSSVLSGVGRKTAEKIYDMFGDNSLNIIENSPRELLAIPGISERKLHMLCQSFQRNQSLHALVKLLAPLNVSYRTIVRIHAELGKGAAGIVRANPYELCHVSYFGFQKADELALKLGDYTNSAFRIRGSIIYALTEAANGDGHICLPKAELIKLCCSKKVLNNTAAAEKGITIDPPAVEEECEFMLSNRQIVEHEGLIYLNRNYEYEKTAAELIAKKILFGEPDELRDWGAMLTDVSAESGITLDAKQLAGAEMALNSSISIVTGGPGTGKTSTLNAVIRAYTTAYPDNTVALAAPTGRAARRMTEQTGVPASTLHKLLELQPDSATDFSVPPEPEDYVQADFIVVDESSMLDAKLLAELMYRVYPETQLLLLGDTDQLPSVGAGNVLRELLSCPDIPNTRLTKIFRQDEGSVIPVNAAAIREGNTAPLRTNKYFKIYGCDDEAVALENIRKMMGHADRHLLETTQILCPMKNRGDCCTAKVNEALHDIVNPPDVSKAEITICGTPYRVGDKVMQTKNAEHATNGELGFITKISGSEDGNKDEISVGILFDAAEQEAELGYEDMMDVVPALGITIHKSQGTEFDAIIVPIFKSMAFFLQRNLLYTAVTRAKRQVVLLTDMDGSGLRTAIRNEDTSKRYTCLQKLIADNIKTIIENS